MNDSMVAKGTRQKLLAREKSKAEAKQNSHYKRNKFKKTSGDTKLKWFGVVEVKKKETNIVKETYEPSDYEKKVMGIKD